MLICLMNTGKVINISFNAEEASVQKILIREPGSNTKYIKKYIK